MTDKPLRLMPETRDFGRSYASMMMAPIYRHTKPEKEVVENRFGYRKVMGFFLPSWQRGSVWTDKQKISFIESAWLGINLGTYTYNVAEIGSPFDNLLIDGQQRMTALQDYIEGKFPVFGYHYFELPILDVRVFSLVTFSSFETQSEDEQYLRDYYNLMNFGGTAHKENERA